jgi:sulfite exporter TauE/SafE
VTALALTVLGASLVGSLHCAGMCGGFVAFYAGAGGRRPGLGHAAYNLGRLAAYATLGALAGALGAALDLAAAPAGIERGAAVLAGALIALWGTRTLMETAGVRVARLEPPAALRGAVARGVAAVAAQSPVTRALVVGLLTGLLPCGWLYAFIVTAAGTGDPLRGAGLMAVFWLGTLPVMAGLGVAVQALAGRIRRWVPAACAVAMIVVGLLAVAGRARAPERHPIQHSEAGAPHAHR